MKIDVHTGRVELPELGLTITPTFTRGQFLASPTAKQATVSVNNGAWCSWNFGPLAVEETIIYFTIYYHSQQIQMLNLGLYRSEWENQNNRPELELREAERLLSHVWKSPSGDYVWGSISSEIDRRSGYASNSIAYNSFLRR